MRKAFAFLTSSLSSINKFSSEETKASAQTTSPNTQKENNKSQIITSNIKNDKNENLMKKNNYDINPLNKIKKNIPNDLKKSTLKKSPPELKKLESTKKTSSRTASSTTVSTLKHSRSNRRNKLSVIKNSDCNGDGESENTSETNSDNEEEEEDDDHVPLGLRFQHFRHSRSINSNYPPPSSQRNQEYYDDDIQIRNVSGMSLHHNRSMTQDPNMEEYHYHSPRSPMPTTPPLIHTSRELLQPRLHYFRERRFSSSASSSSSASVDSSGSRYYRRNNANITPNSSQRNNRYSTYSLPYWNEYEYDDYNPNGYYDDELYDDYDKNRIINIPNGVPPSVPNTPTERMRRMSLNTSSPRSRNGSFSRMYSGLTTTRRSNDSNRLVAGAKPPPPNKYQREATKRMSTSEYHRYQQEMVIAQYLKHGISPTIDDSIPEPLNNNPRGPTLMQVQSMMVNVSSTRPKRLSVIDRGYSGSSYSSSGSNTPPAELARRTSYTRTASDYDSGAGNGGVSSHRRTHSESNEQISSRFSTRQNHHFNHHLQHQSHHSAISSSSSGSGSTYVSSSSSSSGPPTPTSRRSSMMFGSNVNGNSGYIFEKEKRRKSVLRE